HRRSNNGPRQAEGIVVMSNYFSASGTNRPAIVLAALVSAFAAFFIWPAYDTGSRGGYWIAGVLSVLAYLITQSLMVANQWERAVVLRLRTLTGTCGCV